MAKSSKKKPFHAPPIQSRHWAYNVALQVVRSGASRFHRIEGTEGTEYITEQETPTILVANHQNGLMDPLVLTTIINQTQVHWLTRADIFYKKFARTILFAFNQMPIYRQRDGVDDARERNSRIFEICAERLRIGGRMGLFPEGNHRNMKTLRPLRRGISDMVNASLKLDPEMRNLVILPIGIDYEESPNFRRRLKYRIGPPLKIDALINAETNEITPGRLLEPISEALDKLLVNIQPERAYADLLPYVKAMRTTEREDWISCKAKIDRLKSLSDESIIDIQTALKTAVDAGVLQSARAEDVGMKPEDIRSISIWFWLISPVAILGGIPSFPLAKWLESQAQKRVKDPCFISTFKVSIGMFLFPVYWMLVALPIAHFALGGITLTTLLIGYLFNLLGSRISGWWYGILLDANGRRKAKNVWANKSLASSWTNYLQTVNDAIADAHPIR